MTKSFLIATVATLAITAPATAQGPFGRGGGGEQRQQRQAQQQQQRAERPQQQQRAERPQQQRMERQAPQMRMERQAQRMERPQRMERQAPQMRMERAQRSERQAPQMRMERQAQRMERPQRMERQMRMERQAQRMERPQRMERQAQRMERPQRMERQVRMERQSQRMERPQRMERQMERQAQRMERSPRMERQAQRQQGQDRRNFFARRDERMAREASAIRNDNRLSRREQRFAALNQNRAMRVEQAERQVRPQRLEGVARQNIFDRRAAEYARQQGGFQPAYDQRSQVTYTPAQRDGLWQAMAERAQFIRSRDRVRTPQRTLAMVGAPLDTRYYYDDYVPLGYRSMYYDTPDYYYRYDDDYGYLYRVRRDDNIVSTLIPLYGGAFSIGQPMPIAYRSYNVPLAYQPYYYDTPDYYYRYGGGAIYQVDAGTQLISAVVALLAGQSLGVGQLLPNNYSVYNVPYAYRSQYYDTPNNWYRYNDGVIYSVDPRTRLIQSAVPMYDDYYIGNPMPASWDAYNVPMAYRDIYYDSPEYDYRYADGAIYQIDPQTRVVQALAALVTGNNYAMGQVMPASYGVYNVPVAYRDQYYDTDQYAYRYDDGYVYRIDPRTRVINGMYDVVVA